VRAIPWPSGRWRARRRIDTGHAGRLYGRERARGPRLVKTQCSGSSGTEPPLQRPIGFCLQMRPAIGLIDFLSASCLIVFKASLLYPESQRGTCQLPQRCLGREGACLSRTSAQSADRPSALAPGRDSTLPSQCLCPQQTSASQPENSYRTWSTRLLTKARGCGWGRNRIGRRHVVAVRGICRPQTSGVTGVARVAPASRDR